MLRSVKSQIILAISLIILLVLGMTAYLVIGQKTKEINQDILNKALSFAELTHERIINNYENNYKQGAFANFDREMQDIYGLNTDVLGVSIYDYAGKTLYQPSDLNNNLMKGDLDRVQAVIPSVRMLGSGRVVYLQKTSDGINFTDFNGQTVQPISDTEQISNIIYPFRDQTNISRSYSLDYEVTYDSLFQRVRQTVFRIVAIAVMGLLTALFIGYLVAGGITKPIKTLTEGALKIGRGDFKTRLSVNSQSEVGMLANTFNHMAADLEESTKAMIENEKVNHELELAAKIQQELLPKVLPTIEDLDIAASLHAATQVGGDSYDFIPTQKNGNLLFYVADVTGHGMGAGLVSAISNALVPSLMEHYESTKDIIIHLNTILKMKTAPNIFVTCVMALWDAQKKSLQFTQAGHEPVLHYQAKTSTVTQLAYGGLALGMLQDIESRLTTQEVQTEANDVFVLYTDGIPEAWKNEKESFGMVRFEESLKKYASGTAQQIHDGILKDVREFMGPYPQADDITLLVVKRKK